MSVNKFLYYCININMTVPHPDILWYCLNITGTSKEYVQKSSFNIFSMHNLHNFTNFYAFFHVLLHNLHQLSIIFRPSAPTMERTSV